MQFRSKPLVALSIVLVLASALGGWHAPDDADEYAAPAIHHHADHDARFTSTTKDIAAEHCAFCHWLRALGNGAPGATHVLASEPRQFLRSGAVFGSVRTRSQLTIPSRAPPPA